MKTIKRFDLQVEPSQTVDIQFNSEVLGLGVFNKTPCLWVLVDTAHKLMSRTFIMISDDKEVSARLNKTNYIGMFEHKAEVGSHVIHVFEE